jgi:hypothetical protein
MWFFGITPSSKKNHSLLMANLNFFLGLSKFQKSPMRSSLSIILCSCAMVPFSLSGQEVSGSQNDQRQYNLFRPTPRAVMREFSIDRPDVTESPISVDPGHFQFEGDLYKITGLPGEGQNHSYFNALYKMGLTHSWDLQVGIELYSVNVYEGKTVDKGYGTTTVRLKHNFWGNDGGTETALGIIPYFNVSPSGDVGYGAGFPFSVTLSEKLDLGAQPQIDFIPTEDGHDISYFQTVVLGGPLVGKLDFYVEALATFVQSNQLYSANGGLIYNFTPNMKVDVATNVGLNDITPTRAYIGLSFRI